jgi:F-type H+-transporting ATPase subunit b
MARYRLPCLVLLSMIPATAAHAAGEGTPWWANGPAHTAFIALILFLLIVWRVGGFRFVANFLDKRRDEIASQLEEARTLREEAARKLAEAERRQKDANVEAQRIIDQAETDAKAIMAAARDDLERRLARRETLAEARIERASEDAANEVRRAAADAATRAARDRKSVV